MGMIVEFETYEVSMCEEGRRSWCSSSTSKVPGFNLILHSIPRSCEDGILVVVTHGQTKQPGRCMIRRHWLFGGVQCNCEA